jgi:hypothetical protein
MAARVQNLGLVMWDFVMDKSGAGAGFLRELWFPLPIYIPSGSPQLSSLSPEAGTIGLEDGFLDTTMMCHMLGTQKLNYSNDCNFILLTWDQFSMQSWQFESEIKMY